MKQMEFAFFPMEKAIKINLHVHCSIWLTYCFLWNRWTVRKSDSDEISKEQLKVFFKLESVHIYLHVIWCHCQWKLLHWSISGFSFSIKRWHFYIIKKDFLIKSSLYLRVLVSFNIHCNIVWYKTEIFMIRGHLIFYKLKWVLPDEKKIELMQQNSGPWLQFFDKIWSTWHWQFHEGEH